LGVTPVVARKTVEKCEWLAKPVSSASVDNDASVDCSS
jgi:hypothetical protein